ncbi:MAG: hypothetical protein WED34_10135, partial [Planctomycetales bacterium]
MPSFWSAALIFRGRRGSGPGAPKSKSTARLAGRASSSKIGRCDASSPYLLADAASIGGAMKEGAVATPGGPAAANGAAVETLRCVCVAMPQATIAAAATI